MWAIRRILWQLSRLYTFWPNQSGLARRENLSGSPILPIAPPLAW